VATLVHLNGPPAVGKSTIATALVRRRPLALDLDIDELRIRLGGWQEHQDSKHVARGLGLQIADWHLRSGHDVVLPQLLVDPRAVEQVEDVAVRAGAAFVEIVLIAPMATCVQRAANDPQRWSRDHPRRAFADDELVRQIEHARAAFLRFATSRPTARVVEVDGDVDDAVRKVEAVLLG
jgi:predicted kinase